MIIIEEEEGGFGVRDFRTMEDVVEIRDAIKI